MEGRLAVLCDADRRLWDGSKIGGNGGDCSDGNGDSDDADRIKPRARDRDIDVVWWW